MYLLYLSIRSVNVCVRKFRYILTLIDLYIAILLVCQFLQEFIDEGQARAADIVVYSPAPKSLGQPRVLCNLCKTGRYFLKFFVMTGMLC